MDRSSGNWEACWRYRLHNNWSSKPQIFAFGQWKAARRLVERGAQTTLWQAAALGLQDRVDKYFTAVPPPTPDEITNAFWCACHGGQKVVAEFLLGRGADLNWVGHDGLTPLDAATRSGVSELVEWLRSRNARAAKKSTVGGQANRSQLP